jgi:catechol 2,3-dioxygenase-like lactoylglutathione lyase family enzyme
MSRKLAHITLVVKDYDEAIEFYVNNLGFVLIEDTTMSATKRWVLIAPSIDSECKILLAQATNHEQIQSVGNQTGGRVFLFMYTDDLESEYKNFKTHNVTIIREPAVYDYGKVFVFADLYGNLWDVIEGV